MLALVIFDPINRFCWTLVILILLANCMVYGIRAARTELKAGRWIFGGMSWLFGGLTVSRLLYFMSDYLRNGQYIGHVYVAVDGGDAYWFNLLGKMATFAFVLGMVGFNFSLTAVKGRWFLIPSFVNLFLLPALIWSTHSWETLFTYIAFGFNLILLLFLAIMASFRLSKDFQFLSIFLLTGIVLYSVGTVFDSGLFKGIELFSATIPGLFMVSGGLLFLAAIFVSRENTANYTKIMGFLFTLLVGSLIFSIWTSVNVIFYHELNSIVLGAIWLCFVITLMIFIYVIYRIIWTVKILNNPHTPHQLLNNKDFLAYFLHSSPSGRFHVFSSLDRKLIQKIDSWEMETGEKDEILAYLASLSILERRKFLKKMQKAVDSDYFENRDDELRDAAVDSGNSGNSSKNRLGEDEI